MTGLSPRRHRPHRFPARQYRVYVRLSDDEQALVDQAAAANATTAAGYLADAGVAAAREHAGAIASGELADLQRELFAARRALNLLASNVDQAAAIANTTGVVPPWMSDAIRLCVTAVQRVDAVTARIHRKL